MSFQHSGEGTLEGTAGQGAVAATFLSQGEEMNIWGRMWQKD